jgi:predicted ABC-type ATPase
MARPVLYILGGVNGAGKSSIGGHLLTQAGLAWFNPDDFARALVTERACGQTEANIAAWEEGVRRLDAAIHGKTSYAFETTLGGETIAKKIAAAAETHDIMMWYCGLRNAAQHIARVRLRVSRGGHDIPEQLIRKRCRTSLLNLLVLMPKLAHLRVYDNSVDAEIGAEVPEPLLVLEMEAGRKLYPLTPRDVVSTPEWAKPLVEAAFEDNL